MSMLEVAAEDMLSTKFGKQQIQGFVRAFLDDGWVGATPLGSGCEHVGSGSRGRAEHKVWQAANPRICSSILRRRVVRSHPLRERL